MNRRVWKRTICFLMACLLLISGIPGSVLAKEQDAVVAGERTAYTAETPAVTTEEPDDTEEGEPDGFGEKKEEPGDPEEKTEEPDDSEEEEEEPEDAEEEEEPGDSEAVEEQGDTEEENPGDSEEEEEEPEDAEEEETEPEDMQEGISDNTLVGISANTLDYEICTLPSLEGNIAVDNFADLKKALEADVTNTITLENSITYHDKRASASTEYALEVVQGDHTLDLNGHTLTFQCGETGRDTSTMPLHVTGQAKLTIKSSDGEGDFVYEVNGDNRADRFECIKIESGTAVVKLEDINISTSGGTSACRNLKLQP